MSHAASIAPTSRQLVDPLIRVLVVDDDEVDRLIVRRGLQRGAVQAMIEEAETAAETRVRAASGDFDCILLDYNLPGTDGLALVRELRAAGVGTPIVMLTGQGDEEVAVALMKAGAADYLPKSALTPERLAQSLRYAVDVSRAERLAARAERELHETVTRSRFLAEASAALGGSLDMRAILDLVAGLAVPLLGDYCLAYHAGNGDEPIAVASAHADPAKQPAANLIASEYSPARDNPSGPIVSVMRTQRPVLVENVDPASIESVAATAELLAAFRALAPRAGLFVPLVARERLLGALAFVRSGERTSFDAEDRELAEELTRRTAVALDNARLFREAEIARQRTERMQRATAALAGSMSSSEVAAVSVSRVREAIGADTAWIGVRDEKSGDLVSLAYDGYGENERITHFSANPANASMPSFRVMAENAPRWYQSKTELTEQHASLAPIIEGWRQEAVGILPLDAGEGAFGVMSLGFNRRRVFSPADRALALAMTQQCAQALARARLYEVAQAARAEAEAARREAEEANRAKSEFLARMSHDLRTPLNAIGGFSQLLEMEVHGAVSDGQRTALQRIKRAQEHLLTLINDILSFARLEAGQVQISPKPVALKPVLEELQSLVAGNAIERGLTLTVEPVDDSVSVLADRSRLTQILLNLTSNAIKFTESGSVTWETILLAGRVELRIRDTGRGIPTDRIQVIFDPFVQARRAEDEEKGGVGLGLAISRDLARLMGGDLTVESTEGAGATFILNLPRAN